MSSVRELHDQAVEFGHLANTAREAGDLDGALELARRAFDLESQAVGLIPDGIESEPTRSILYRSAASFAFQCNDLEEARRMAGLGLSGYPSPKIERDLLAVLDQVKFSTYMQEQGGSLDGGELLLAMHGNAVGHGVVLYKEFKDRIEIAIRLVNKTIQRMMNRDYQSGGRISREYKLFQQAIGVPAAQNSFAMTLKLIKRKDEYQPSLLVQDAQQVIDDIIYGVGLINNNQEEALREHINDNNYYSNFVYLVRGIAPDGDKISHITLSSITGGTPLTRSRMDIEPIDIPSKGISEEVREYDDVIVEGILKYADDQFRAGEQLVGIEISESDKRLIKPGAGIDDLVEQYWQRRVQIVGRTDGAYIYPTDITPLEDEE